MPLATLARACEVAEPGSTIVLRAAVYREMLRPKNGRVTIRAMGDEKVTLSGADVIEGWKREAEGSWSAPLELEPRKVLRDGELWSQVTYDRSAKRLIVRKGDPRLHLYETVVREQGIDLNGKKNVRVEGITVENTLK